MPAWPPWAACAWARCWRRERSRLNVTRAIRAALARLDEALPGAGASLDRRIRTGFYSVYDPAPEDARWIVQS